MGRRRRRRRYRTGMFGRSSYRRRRKSSVFGRSFSWNRALGITSMKQSFARTTGIPTTKQGRRAKIRRWFGLK